MSIILNVESEEDEYKLNVTRKPSTVGRSRKADLTISDDRISGIHCSFTIDSSDKVVVKDLGSTNGTFLGASQIEESLLMIGDKVRIGNTVINIISSELSPKEKKNLTQYADNVDIKYLELKDSSDSTRHAIKIRQKAIKKEEKQVLKQDKLPLNNIDEPAANEENSSSTQQQLKDKIIKKANKLKKGNRATYNDYENEHTLAQEPETGRTGFIEIDKIIKSNKPKKIYKPKKIEEDEEENPSLLGKLKSIFSKKK